MLGISQALILLVFLAFVLLLFGQVLRKAGFSMWWALLMLVPIVNIIMVWVFAFSEWPAEKSQR